MYTFFFISKWRNSIIILRSEYIRPPLTSCHYSNVVCVKRGACNIIITGRFEHVVCTFISLKTFYDLTPVQRILCYELYIFSYDVLIELLVFSLKGSSDRQPPAVIVVYSMYVCACVCVTIACKNGVYYIVHGQGCENIYKKKTTFLLVFSLVI